MDNEIYLKNRKSLYNAKLIQKKVHQVLTQLCDKVVRGSLHAHGQLKVSEKRTVHRAVQCTGDLSDIIYTNSINVAIRELLDYSSKMESGRAIYESCYIRYELYHFYKYALV
ncbi:hypothetical protein PRUPE_8G113500 [Prunus persica]|uniref:Gnk2-homologous domain-containing protein n=1 Tax=Prunus persica TaxID=3760 RepID=A0A251MZI9_PRUPE|nr:hypothetical protein PRUPE_8G113500 [Prunus persica]